MLCFLVGKCNNYYLCQNETMKNKAPLGHEMSVLCYSKETVTKHRFIMEIFDLFVSDLQLVTESRFRF